jgi:hypothetical protein
MNAWFGDPRALAKAARPAFGVVTSRSLARLRALHDDPTAALPVVLVLALSLPIALLIGVPTGGIGIGFALGLIAAGGVALHGRARARQDAAALAVAIAEARTDADQRVLLVTRQYEWAVNDVANLRDALQRARAHVASNAPRAEAAAPAHSPDAPNGAGTQVSVALIRYIRESDPPTTLRFGADGLVPEQVRVVADGNVVAISARSIDLVNDPDTSFAIRVNEDLARGFGNVASGITIEALVDDLWSPVVLRLAPARAEVRDKRGRAFRGATEERASL